MFFFCGFICMKYMQEPIEVRRGTLAPLELELMGSNETVGGCWKPNPGLLEELKVPNF